MRLDFLLAALTHSIQPGSDAHWYSYVNAYNTQHKLWVEWRSFRDGIDYSNSLSSLLWKFQVMPKEHLVQ